MNKKFLILVAIGTMLSLATYFGLNHYFPYQKEEVKSAHTVSVDEVFTGGLQATRTDAETAVEAPQDNVPEQENMSGPESADAEPGATQTAEASMPAEAVEPAAEMDTDAAVTSEAAAPGPESEAEVAESAPVEEPELAQVDEPAPAPEPVAPKPVRKPAKSTASKPAAAPQPSPAQPPLVDWWGEADANGLSLVFAASSSTQRAIVLMFSGAFDSADSANRHIRIIDGSGDPVTGRWQVSDRNKRMLLFPVGSSGRYTVSIKAGIADRSGRALARDMRGPVQVK